MAAFIAIAYSISVYLYRTGCVFVHSGASLNQTLNYLKEERNQYLIQRYLHEIDSIYDRQEHSCQKSNFSQHSSSKCIKCGQNHNNNCNSTTTTKRPTKMTDIVTGTVDFMQVERAEEVFENGPSVSNFV